MRKLLVALGLALPLCLLGCSGSDSKADDSMESMLKDAQKKNATHADTSKKSGGVKADLNAPANNVP